MSLVLVCCKISRGAFSSERIFKFNLKNGKQYTGVADYRHCMDKNKNILSKEYPYEDQIIEGYIQAYTVSSKLCNVLSIPDGEVVIVNAENITRPKNHLVDVGDQIVSYARNCANEELSQLH